MTVVVQLAMRSSPASLTFSNNASTISSFQTENVGCNFGTLLESRFDFLKFSSFPSAFLFKTPILWLCLVPLEFPPEGAPSRLTSASFTNFADALNAGSDWRVVRVTRHFLSFHETHLFQRPF